MANTKNNMLDAVQTLVDNGVGNAGYNRTKGAIILSRNVNNTYTIQMDGMRYTSIPCYGGVEHNVGDSVKVIIPNNQTSQMFILPKMSSFAEMMLAIYPVGSIYITTVDINPSTLFGGTWVQIKDRFLLSAGDSYVAGNTGGEATHLLTSSESGLPSHTHGNSFALSNNTQLVYSSDAVSSFRATISSSTGDYSYLRKSYNSSGSVGRHTVSLSGSVSNSTAQDATTAHNNMPPYLTVYVWKRIGIEPLVTGNTIIQDIDSGTGGMDAQEVLTLLQNNGYLTKTQMDGLYASADEKESDSAISVADINAYFGDDEAITTSELNDVMDIMLE